MPQDIQHVGHRDGSATMALGLRLSDWLFSKQPGVRSPHSGFEPCSQ